MTSSTISSPAKWKQMTRAPPRLPVPLRCQRTLRAPSAHLPRTFRTRDHVTDIGALGDEIDERLALLSGPDCIGLLLERGRFDHGAHDLSVHPDNWFQALDAITGVIAYVWQAAHLPWAAGLRTQALLPWVGAGNSAGSYERRLTALARADSDHQ